MDIEEANILANRARVLHTISLNNPMPFSALKTKLREWTEMPHRLLSSLKLNLFFIRISIFSGSQAAIRSLSKVVNQSKIVMLLLSRPSFWALQCHTYLGPRE